MEILIKGMEMPTSCNDGGNKTRGIYINGWVMPMNCFTCPFRLKVSPDDIKCMANGKVFEETFSLCTERRSKDCPLVPVPPHGRLIDADALIHEFEKAQGTMAQHGQEYSCSFMSSSREISTEWYFVEDMVENAPTIIPAEEGET